MKNAITVITVLALVLIVINAFQIDLEAPFTDDSLVAVITILASSCAILLMQILKISKKIDSRVKRRD